MARRRSNPYSVPGLTLGDFMTLTPNQFAAKAKRLRANSGRAGRTKRNAMEYTGYGPLNNPMDEYLALEGYHARVLWPKYTPGGGINSGNADYIPTMTHGSLFTRDINLLRNGASEYKGMPATQARFGGTCRMTGQRYERGEKIVKVPDVGWCTLSAVKAQSARENRGRGGRRNSF